MTNTNAPIDWWGKFKAAHGFVPPFTVDEMTEPWCDECSDFHSEDEPHSYVEGE